MSKKRRVVQDEPGLITLEPDDTIKFIPTHPLAGKAWTVYEVNYSNGWFVLRRGGWVDEPVEWSKPFMGPIKIADILRLHRARLDAMIIDLEVE